MRRDNLTITDLKHLLGKLDMLSTAGTMLFEVGLIPTFSLMPGRPLMTVPPLFDDIQPPAEASPAARTEAATVGAGDSPAVAPPAAPASAAGDDISQPSTLAGLNAGVEAEAGPRVPAAPALPPVAGAATTGDDLAHPATDPAPLLPGDRGAAAPAPGLQRAPEAKAPAAPPSAAGEPPAARWSELDISAAIRIYVDTILLGGTAARAYELIAGRFDRTPEAIRQRFGTSWKARAHQALETARKVEASGTADPAPAPQPALPPVAPMDIPIGRHQAVTQHLDALPRPKGWTEDGDLELVDLIRDNVDAATIAATLEIAPSFVRQRWDQLTGLHKDDDDKPVRRFTGAELGLVLRARAAERRRGSAAAR